MVTRMALCAILAVAQTSERQYQYICTHSSKYGIHPPKVLNKKAARAAWGDDEHPYGLGYPTSVVVDKSQRLRIADSGTNSVHLFNPETGAYREFREAGDVPFRQPSGLATDRQGYVM